MKNKDDRLNIRDTLDHPWFNSLGEISSLRRKASKDGNEFMQFITYSNTDANVAKEVQRKSLSPTGRLDADFKR